MAVVNQIAAFVKRYKILHIVFWVYATWTLACLNNQAGDKNIPVNYVNALLSISCRILLVYVVIYKLAPKYLQKKKYGLLILLTAICVLAGSMLENVAEDTYKLIRVGRHIKPMNRYIYFVSDVVDEIDYLAIYFVMVAIPAFYFAEKRNRQLEKEKLETELNFLKAQVNPQFLFGTLSSIHGLIRGDKTLAQDTLMGFSDLLRYQLYDCTNPYVPLSKEVDFLNEYVKLEAIRLNDYRVEVTMNMQPEAEDMKIAPFILLPFVENAVRQISGNTAENIIKIAITTEGDQLVFSVANNYRRGPHDIKDGEDALKDVQRRLQLLYPGKHRLNRIIRDGTYTTQLQLKCRA